MLPAERTQAENSRALRYDARMGEPTTDGASKRAVLLGGAACLLFVAIAVAGWTFELYHRPAGIALLLAMAVMLLSAFTGWAASALRASELARRRADEATRETRERDRALRASEARLHAVVESALDAIAVMDGDGVVVGLNAAAESMFGYPRADAIGRRLGELIVPEAQRAAHERGLARIGATGESRILGRRVELTAMRADGSEFPAEVSVTRASASGEPLLFTGFIRDLSERREAEKVRAQNEELEALTHELTELTVKLDDVNRELESFSYSVSHDLRAPLRAIDGFSAVLLDDHAAALGDDGKEYLERIRRSAKHMGALIDDILRLANIARTDMQTEDVDLSELARDIVSDLARSHPERTVEVTIAETMPVRGDAGMLRVALVNLLDNAWKFTGKRDRGRIEVGTTSVDGERAFHVTDNGAGFDMQYAGQLFTPFKRLHRADEFAGTGVGLATVERVVRRHGGRIWAESKAGEGTTFYFTLRDDGPEPA